MFSYVELEKAWERSAGLLPSERLHAVFYDRFVQLAQTLIAETPGLNCEGKSYGMRNDQYECHNVEITYRFDLSNRADELPEWVALLVSIAQETRPAGPGVGGSIEWGEPSFWTEAGVFSELHHKLDDDSIRFLMRGMEEMVQHFRAAIQRGSPPPEEELDAHYICLEDRARC